MVDPSSSILIQAKLCFRHINFRQHVSTFKPRLESRAASDRIWQSEVLQGSTGVGASVLQPPVEHHADTFWFHCDNSPDVSNKYSKLLLSNMFHVQTNNGEEATLKMFHRDEETEPKTKSIKR